MKFNVTDPKAFMHELRSKLQELPPIDEDANSVIIDTIESLFNKEESLLSISPRQVNYLAEVNALRRKISNMRKYLDSNYVQVEANTIGYICTGIKGFEDIDEIMRKHINAMFDEIDVKCAENIAKIGLNIKETENGRESV